MPDGTSSTKAPEITPEDKSLARLIAAIGKSDASDAVGAWFENWFRALKRDAQNRLPAFEAEVEHREVLRKLLANAEERRKLREQLAPFRHEFARVRWIKLNVTGLSAEDRDTLMTMINPDFVALLEQTEEADIKTLLEISDDYRKGAIRKLVIEPFLVMLRNEDIEPTRERPLNRMVDAVLNYLGVDPRRHPRPSRSGIETIIRETKRDFEKRAAQHPRE